MAGVGGPLGTGGMATKLAAAKKAAASGIAAVIADGRRDGVLAAVLAGAGDVGTFFRPVGDRLASRKRWIAYTLKLGGTVVVDDGAPTRDRRARAGACSRPGCATSTATSASARACSASISTGHEFARGLVSYSAAELDKIKGRHSREIEATLGYKMGDEVIHRDDLVAPERLTSHEGDRPREPRSRTSSPSVAPRAPRPPRSHAPRRRRRTPPSMPARRHFAPVRTS